MSNLHKRGITYTRKENGTLYAGPLDQSGKVGGTNEATRNSVHNPTRMTRILDMGPHPQILDFGCGSGMFVDFLCENGLKAHGYDKYSAKYNNEIPRNFYNVVTMVEVIEHTAEPYSELDAVFLCLVPGGTVMIETSFTDFLEDEDPYIEPAIGHSTIFSHLGLDELMISKGFEVGNHINRNVRVYHKPGERPAVAQKAPSNGVTLITMGQGNPMALQRTLESFKGLYNEVVFGDVLIFNRDRELIHTFQRKYNMGIVELPFNYIFEHGFSATLNFLASFASNDLVLYMNVGEVMDGEFDVLNRLSPDFNTYYIDHATETHHWYRLYNRKQLEWGGMIHEEVSGGSRRPYPYPVFRFGDSEKDMESEFYAKVMNDVKELVYFNQYIKLVENPEKIGVTNRGWVEYAKDGYESLKERMNKKGARLQAFKENDLVKFMEDIFTNPEFEKERHESTDLINFQGARKDIL